MSRKRDQRKRFGPQEMAVWKERSRTVLGETVGARLGTKGLINPLTGGQRSSGWVASAAINTFTA